MNKSEGLNKDARLSLCCIERKFSGDVNSIELLDGMLFLPKGEGRLGEGGQRTRGFLKSSQVNLPIVTVVTVVYNGECFLEETILSVINQSYKNIQYIIIDGGSTDRTIDVIKKYEEFIDYWVSEKDKGIYDAMNKGIELATGDWINFMNGGDKFYSDIVFSEIISLVTPACNVCFGKSVSFYGGLEALRYKDFSADSLDFFMRKMPNHQAIFIRKDRYKSFRYSLDLKYCSDTLYLRSVFSGAVVCEYSGIVSRFELGGVSNFYNKFSVYKRMVIEYRMLGYGFVYSFLAHSFKYCLQCLLGKDRYLKLYITKMLKE